MSNREPPFIAVILRRLKELGLNEAELARRANLGKGYFSNVLRGRMTTPDVGKAIRIAKVLQMDIIKSSTAEHLIGFVERATSRGKFTVRAVGSREKSPSSDVLIDWAAPIQVVLKKAV